MPIKKKRTTSSILAERIKGVEGKVKEIEDIIVETVTDAIKAPKPKDGDKGEKGDDGKSIQGEKGEKGDRGKSIKGDPGDPGVSGISIKGEQGEDGEDGEDGIGFVNATLKGEDLLIERSDGEIINVGKIKKEIIQRTIHTGGGGASVPPHKLLPIGTKGDILAHNGTTWERVPIGTNKQYYTPNNAASVGASWEDKGFSYLTDELDDVLTDELNNALEGRDAVDANALVNDDPNLVEITFADSPFTVTRPSSRRTILDVDCTNGVVIIILYPMIKFDQIHIKKTDSSGNKLTYRGNGFNIDDLTERDISTQYNDDKLVGGTTQWRRR